MLFAVICVLHILLHRADELEEYVNAIRGGDEAATLKRLEDHLKKIKPAFREVKGLTREAQEAAAKCQVMVIHMPRCSCCVI